jgi:hypothetical protein
VAQPTGDTRWHNVPVTPGTGSTLEVFLNDPGHVRKASPDEDLLARYLLIQRAIGRPVTIVTGDLGMHLRADAEGFGQAEMPDKYSKDAMLKSAAAD